MMPASLQALQRAAPFVFAILWSTGYIGARLGMPFAEPFTFLSLRFALVLALLVPVFLFWRLPWPRGRGLVDALISGALMHGIYLGGIFWAVDRGMPTGIAALIVSLQPLTTALLAWPILGERPGRWMWAGLILGLAGTGVVLWPKIAPALGTPNVGTPNVGTPNVSSPNVGTPSAAGAGLGDISTGPLVVAIIALLSITLGTIHQKRQVPAIDPRTSFAVQFVGALAVAGVSALLLETRAVIWSGQFVFALGWLVIVLSLGAFGLLMLMLHSNAVTKVAALFYLIPVITALMAYPLFGEVLEPLQLAGMGLVVVAVFVAGRQPEK
jgi:drug/metabolite transporter (DMT)-like permease